ncbi:hypothetical protein ACNRBH_21120 [Ralstonia pseudosolanacearum]|uniref:hypothetical protein n=1 Tax=Ralstonia pseudosolanacearum TaxID=1310165 RepID=UPI002675B4C4|nr:hypothetical protein [Ralstonia pseudosolanacearum]MDO3529354.1 hypothetical protein [Ralstonia pseudosolanacearum]MDO3534901.1 hypothetical protein [Ralstonia pseudosolanacearum]
MRAAKITAIDAGAPARLSTDLAQWHAQGPSEARIRRQLATEDVDAAGADRLVRAARVSQLRRQTFHASNEALRAQALDGSPRHE